MTDTPVSLAETMREIVESFSQDLHVALPGTVDSYDEATQTADIVPGLARYVPARDDEAEDKTEALPILSGVPVIWPFGSGMFVHPGLVRGDSVLLVFCSTDPGAWRAGDGSQVDPNHPLRFGLGGAVAIPGLRRRGANFTPDGASMGLDGNAAQIKFRAGQVQVGGTKTLAEYADLETHLEEIAASIGVLATAIGALTGSYPAVTYDVPGKGAVLGTNPIATTVTRGD